MSEGATENSAVTNAWGEPMVPNPVYGIIAARTAQVAIPAAAVLAGLSAVVRGDRLLPLAVGGGIGATALLSAYFVATFSARLSVPGLPTRTRLPKSIGNAVALTFDDGPHPDTTPHLLEALARANARATFFLVSDRAAQFPELARRIFAAGHGIGVHGRRHRAMVLQSAVEIRNDLETATAQIEIAIGTQLPRPLLLRPPYGFKTWTLCRTARRLDFETIAWSLDARDYDPGDSTAIVRRVSDRLTNGDIILLHERPGSRSTIEALPELLALCAARSLSTVSLSACAT